VKENRWREREREKLGSRANMAKLVLTEEERVVDQELGYPRGYAKLCRHALAGMIEGFSMPFSAGPPQRFVPYSLAPVDVSSLPRNPTPST